MNAKNKLDRIRKSLVWRYGYFFKKMRQSIAEKDWNSYGINLSHASEIMCLLVDYFDYSLEPLMNAIYPTCRK